VEGPVAVISGCPVDANVFSCLIRYAPEVLLLGALVLVGVAGVAINRSNCR